MKPFNLEEAKAGKPVVTRGGRPARILCFDRKHDRFPIAGLITNEGGKETCQVWTLEGCYYGNGRDSYHDLCMAPEKRQGWVNIYPQGITGRTVYSNERKAKWDAGAAVIATVPVEWEE